MPLKQVGIFIDFENLIYGLTDRYGEQGAYEHFKTQKILDFAEKHGRVRWAWAYADWRIKTVNRFQSDLYTRGVELIHVLGRGNKNAVDMKMATDMIEAHFTQKGVETFVLCSGDRDFLPVINTLRRYGKSVIGVAPQRAMSMECKRLCTEAVTYESLLNSNNIDTEMNVSTEDITKLKEEVVGIVRSSHPQELTGAQLKHFLMQSSSRNGQFDERHYGYVKLSDLIAQFEDVLLVKRPETGDVLISLLETTMKAQADVEMDEDHLFQVALSALKGYQYNTNAAQRRIILEEIFQLIHQNGGVRWANTLNQLCDRLNLSRSQANKYHAVLLQSQAFMQLDPSDEYPVKQRLMRLIDELDHPDLLIERYEQSILLKVYARQPQLPPEIARRILGLSSSIEDLEYIQKILKNIHDELQNKEERLMNDD